MKVIVTDERPGLCHRTVAEFENVPAKLTNKEVRAEYGIAEHLTLYRQHRGAAPRLASAGRH